jgi:hypothetical protein
VTTERPGPPRSTPAAPIDPLLPSLLRMTGRFVSLRTKFLVGTLLVVASVMSALVLIVEHRQREAIIREVQRRGDALARDLAAVSTGPLVLYNYTQLEQNVVRVSTETDVAYAMILDRDGRVAAHDHRPEMVGTLLTSGAEANASQTRLIWGLILLGFTSLYREGFEVVLFLQTYHLRLGGGVVLKGTLLGLGLSGLVAILTFVMQQRLPYRNMLVTTGVLLGGVLLVMVGEQAQEMQLAHWISTTPVPWLVSLVPDWVGLWFAIFPTYETLIAQLIAAILVVGSYYAARRVRCTAEPA